MIFQKITARHIHALLAIMEAYSKTLSAAHGNAICADGLTNLTAINELRGNNMSFDINNALVELIDLSMCGKQASAIDLANEIESEYIKHEQHYRAQSDPILWVALTPAGKIAYFDGKPMYSTDETEIHTVPLYKADSLDIEPQPPCDNDHVEDGCELFSHAMPKSEGRPVFGKLFSETIGEYSPAVLGKFDSFAPDTIKRLIDIHAGTEIADCIAGLTWRLSIVEQRDEILSKKVIELSTPQPTTDISELVKALSDCVYAMEHTLITQNQELRVYTDYSSAMENGNELIAKHTVKA